MASDRAKILYAKSYLAREYANRLDDLKQLARDVFAVATDTVTLTSASFEGGSGSGQIVFEKHLLGTAIEELIAEAGGAVDGRRVVFSDFSRNFIQT